MGGRSESRARDDGGAAADSKGLARKGERSSELKHAEANARGGNGRGGGERERERDLLGVASTTLAASTSQRTTPSAPAAAACAQPRQQIQSVIQNFRRIGGWRKQVARSK